MKGLGSASKKLAHDTSDCDNKLFDSQAEQKQTKWAQKEADSTIIKWRSLKGLHQEGMYMI
jgi:hypothetical protein